MNKSEKINVSRDFSKYPGPRYASLGKSSGEVFRDQKLIPALESNEKVVVELDGTAGYGSSFLEEAFGGTIRKGIEITEGKLDLVSCDKDLVSEIWDYIASAQKTK